VIDSVAEKRQLATACIGPETAQRPPPPLTGKVSRSPRHPACSAFRRSRFRFRRDAITDPILPTGLPNWRGTRHPWQTPAPHPPSNGHCS
jgi:hypothetical protein